jgi:hypothetical protein
MDRRSQQIARTIKLYITRQRNHAGENGRKITEHVRGAVEKVKESQSLWWYS